MSNTKEKINLYRVTYTIKNDGKPFISELIVKSKKKQEEIDFAEAIKKYWQKNDANMFYFDKVSFVEKIGEE